MFFKFVQPENGAPEAFLFNVFGNFILVKAVQFLNDSLHILSTFPKFTLDKLVHPENAHNPISFTLFGIVISVILVADSKALLPNVTTVFPSKVEGIEILPVKSEGLLHFNFSI